jgi:hypothetical protein
MHCRTTTYYWPSIYISVLIGCCCVYYCVPHVEALKYTVTSSYASTPTCVDNGDSVPVTYSVTATNVGFDSTLAAPLINNMRFTVKFNKFDDGALGNGTTCITTTCNSPQCTNLASGCNPFYNEISISLSYTNPSMTMPVKAAWLQNSCYDSNPSSIPIGPWIISGSTDTSLPPLCTSTGVPKSGSFAIDNIWTMNFRNRPAVGSYTLTLEDGKLFDPTCWYGIGEFTVWPYLSVVGVETSSVTCYGKNDAKWTFTVAGGTGQYKITSITSTGGTSTPAVPTYSTATFGSATTLPNPSQITVSGLSGNGAVYTINVVDANDPMSIGSLQFTPTQPGVLRFPSAVVATQSTCQTVPNDVVTFKLTGGTTPYTITAASTTTTISPVGYKSIGSNEYQLTQTLPAPSSTSYTLSVVDAHGCLTASAAFTMQDAPPITFTTSKVDPTCFGKSDGSITVGSVTGTSVDYYINNVKNTATNPAKFIGLADGTYAIKVSVSGCDSKSSNVVLTQPPLLTVSSSGYVEPKCADQTQGQGSVKLTVGGGNVGKATLSIVSTTSTSSNAIAPVTITIPSSPYTPIDTTLSGIKYYGGGYTFQVLDTKGCSASGTLPQTTLTSVTCSIGAIADQVCAGYAMSTTVRATGGTASWKATVTPNGASGASSNVALSVINTDYAITSGTNPGASPMTVTLLDGNSCSGSCTQTYKLASALDFTTTITGPGCAGDGDGKIDISVTNGKTPYKMQYSGPVTGTLTSSSNTFSITNLKEGKYSLVLTDNQSQPAAQQCSRTRPATLAAQSTLSSVTLAVDTAPTCGTVADGKLVATAVFTTQPGDTRQITVDTSTVSSISSGTSVYFNSLAAGNYVANAQIGTCKLSSSAVLMTAQRSSIVITSAKATPAACGGVSSVAVAYTGDASPAIEYSFDGGTTWTKTPSPPPTATLTVSGGGIKDLQMRYVGASPACLATFKAIDTGNVLISGTAKVTRAKCPGSSWSLALSGVAGGSGTSSYLAYVKTSGGTTVVSHPFTGTSTSFGSSTSGSNYQIVVANADGTCATVIQSGVDFSVINAVTVATSGSPTLTQDNCPSGSTHDGTFSSDVSTTASTFYLCSGTSKLKTYTTSPISITSLAATSYSSYSLSAYSDCRCTTPISAFTIASGTQSTVTITDQSCPTQARFKACASPTPLDTLTVKYVPQSCGAGVPSVVSSSLSSATGACDTSSSNLVIGCAYQVQVHDACFSDYTKPGSVTAAAVTAFSSQACYSPSAAISVTGGTGAISVAPTTAPSTATTFSIAVKDSRGCTDTLNAVALTLTPKTIAQSTCNNGAVAADGSFQVQLAPTSVAASGTTISWSASISPTPPGSSYAAATNTFSGLPAGTYTVTASAAGYKCAGTPSTTTVIGTTDPTVKLSDISCPKGTTSATNDVYGVKVCPGIAGRSYSVKVTPTASSGPCSTAITSSPFKLTSCTSFSGSGFGACQYSYVVSDTTCALTAPSFTNTLASVSPITPTPTCMIQTANSVALSGTQYTLGANGGTAPYKYTITSNGFSCTSASTCSGTPSSTNSADPKISFDVTDSHGCTTNPSLVVPVIIVDGKTTTPNTCASTPNGQATISVTYPTYVGYSKPTASITGGSGSVSAPVTAGNVDTYSITGAGGTFNVAFSPTCGSRTASLKITNSYITIVSLKDVSCPSQMRVRICANNYPSTALTFSATGSGCTKVIGTVPSSGTVIGGVDCRVVTGSFTTGCTYTLAVTDACGTTSTSSVTMGTAPSAFSVNPTCVAGTPSSMKFSGGSTPYTYSTAPSYTCGGTACTFSSSYNGVVDISLTDLNGCTYSNTFYHFTPTVTKVDNFCPTSAPQGVLTVVADTSGTPKRTFDIQVLKTDGTSVSVSNADLSVMNVFTGLTATKSVTITVNSMYSPTCATTITTPMVKDVALVGPSTCSCPASPSSFSVSWTNGNGAVTLKVSAEAGCTSPTAGTSLSASLAAGTQTYTFTDAAFFSASCTYTVSYTDACNTKQITAQQVAATPSLTPTCLISSQATEIPSFTIAKVSGTTPTLDVCLTSTPATCPCTAGSACTALTFPESYTATLHIAGCSSCAATTLPITTHRYSLSVVPDTCPGASNGQVIATFVAKPATVPSALGLSITNAGGTDQGAPKTTGSTTATWSGLAADTYTLQSSSCFRSSASLPTAKVVTQFYAAGSVVDRTCSAAAGQGTVFVTFGNAYGSARKVTATPNGGACGGATTIVSNIADGATSATITGLTPGCKYDMTLEIAGCTAQTFGGSPITLATPSAFGVSPTCWNTAATASQAFTFSGGSGALSVTSTSPTFACTLPSGSSTCTVTSAPSPLGVVSIDVKDANQCTGSVKVLALSLTAVQQQPNVCGNTANANGILTVNIDPAAPYTGGTWQISAAATGKPSPAPLTTVSKSPQSFSGLQDGSWVVSATDQLSGLTQFCSATAAKPAALGTAQVTLKLADVTCKQPTLRAQISATPVAVGSYTIQYNSGSGTCTIPADTTNAPSSPVDVLVSSGCTYSVKVFDTSCPAINTASDTLTMSSAGTMAIALTTNTAPRCPTGNDASMSLTVTGGVDPKTVKCPTCPSAPSCSGVPLVCSVTGLSGNTAYTFSASDTLSCSTSQTFTSKSNPPVLAVASLSKGDVTCNGGKDGTVTVSGISGGTLGAGYTVKIGGINVAYTSNVATQTGLTANTYSVQIFDGASPPCSATLTPQTVLQPAALVISSTSVTQPTCSSSTDGKVALSFSGGSGNFQVTMTDGTSTSTIYTGTGSSTTQSGLLANTDYTFSVTDTSHTSCAAGTLKVALTQQSKLTAALSKQVNLQCNAQATGAITVTASNAAGSATHTLTGTAPSVPAKTLSGTTVTFSNLAAGKYSVVTKESTLSCTVTNTLQITQPAALVVSVSKTDILCGAASGGALELGYTLSAGLGPSFSAVVCPGSHSSQPTPVAVAGCRSQTGVTSNPITFTGSFTPTTYTWWMRDETHTCNYQVAEVTFVSVKSTLQLAVQDRSCLNYFAVFLTPSKGYTALTNQYKISTNPAGFSDNMAATTYTVPAGSGTLISDFYNPMGSAVHVLLADDRCSVIETFKFTPPSVALAIRNLATTISRCDRHDGPPNDGAVHFEVAGGTAPYFIKFSLWGCVTQTGQYAVGSLPPGTSAQDVANCNDVIKFYTTGTVLTSLARTSSVDGGLVSFYGLPGDDTAVLQVTVTDAHQCTKSQTFIVPSLGRMTVHVNEKQQVQCSGSATSSLSIDMAFAGGTSRKWSYTVSPHPSYPTTYTGDSTTGYLMGDVPPGLYNFIVQDMQGCTQTANYTVSNPPPITTPVNLITALACQGDQNAQLNVTINGGRPPYTLLINPKTSTGQNAVSIATNGTFTITGLAAVRYKISIVDSLKCSQQVADIKIDQPGRLVLTHPKKDDVWYMYHTYRIEWTYTGGLRDVSVLVTLERDTGQKIVIQPLYSARRGVISGLDFVPHHLVPGKYKVTVVNLHNCVNEDSNYFEIRALRNRVGLGTG